MRKHYYLITLLLLSISCATYEAKYAVPFVEIASGDEKEVEHTFYLIGDAGKSPMGELNPALKKFKAELENAPENSTAIFLGDNIYPAGMPDKDDEPEEYRIAKNHLDAQLSTLKDFKGNLE